MKIGLGPIQLRGMTRTLLESLAHAAVAASFDSIWVAESRDEGTGGGVAAAAMVAQVVPIRVGAVIDSGAYHPLYMAEDIAVADLASQGRIEIMLRGAPLEHARLLIEALSGAHIRFDGAQLHVPARLEANQPVPDALALNPRPAQPVVPIWIDGIKPGVARELGVGVAGSWRAGVSAPPASARWPGLLLCPADADPADLLRATAGAAAYFLVSAGTPSEAASAGRRLVGPLRMPALPEWIANQ